MADSVDDADDEKFDENVIADESVVVTDDVALVTADEDVTGLSVGYGLTEPESDPDVVTVTVCVVE